MKDRKKELLEALESQLKEDDDFGELSIFTAEELNAPVDILRAEVAEFGPDLVSILGEFFFIPVEDEDTYFFTTVLTISHTVPPEAAPDVAAASARLNYYLPCGAFSIGDNDRNFVFKYTALLSSADKKDAQMKEISRAVDTALGVAERYVGFLLLVLKNEITVEEMVNMLRGENSEE